MFIRKISLLMVLILGASHVYCRCGEAGRAQIRLSDKYVDLISFDKLLCTTTCEINYSELRRAGIPFLYVL